MNPDTDRWVRSDEARTKLRDLLDEVAHNDAHIYLLRYDKPAAVIVPVEWYEEMKAQLEKRDD
jgi:prevent-host-death family protein